MKLIKILTLVLTTIFCLSLNVEARRDKDGESSSPRNERSYRKMHNRSDSGDMHGKNIKHDDEDNDDDSKSDRMKKKEKRKHKKEKKEKKRKEKTKEREDDGDSEGKKEKRSWWR